MAKIMHSIFNEKWADLPGYWGEYQVSNKGRIKRLGWVGVKYNVDDKICPLTPEFPPKNRYYIHTTIKRKRYSNHYATLLTFKSDRPNGLVINHKNGVHFENHIENLEYCTHQYNLNHAIDALGKKGTWHERYGKDHYMSKLVGQYDLSCNLLAKYWGTNEAMRMTGVDGSTISKCCRNHPEYSQTGGFKWKYL